MKDAIDMWTRPVRLGISVAISLPLGVSMIGVGVYSLQSCATEKAIVKENMNNSKVVEKHGRVLDESGQSGRRDAPHPHLAHSGGDPRGLGTCCLLHL
eukprot:TRINITY_DN20481_c0_g1_i1.p1 TRINITY_DN20481_c0_g1~~TRINITY_DN20481_c0_g1_i1.p1  ORF type:complete len:108 (+),score=21.63 TRINITY_DN20481_c0_g1_i1:31-324(+)